MNINAYVINKKEKKVSTTFPFVHLRLYCEDSEVVLDSEVFMSQLEEEGGGTGAPRPGSRPIEVLLPWVLTGGVAWDEES